MQVSAAPVTAVATAAKETETAGVEPTVKTSTSKRSRAARKKQTAE